MATCKNLNTEAWERLYCAMGDKISQQSDQMYKANKCKSGQYCGSWFYFREAWLQDKVYNLDVIEALALGYPPMQFKPIS